MRPRGRLAAAAAGVVVLAALGLVSGDRFGDAPRAVFLRCHDGDTCTFDVPDWPPVIGREIPVRLRGIDTPEIRGACEDEKRRAIAARDFLVERLAAARRIELRDVGRGKYFRVVAEIWADGRPVADALLEAGLARPYDGGARQGWC